MLAFAFLLAMPILLAEENAEPEVVQVAVYILNLGKFDLTTGSFTVDFYLGLKCSNPCSPETFEFMNGRASSIEKIIDEPNEKFYRIQANLNSQVGLKEFPFDQQDMQIVLEDKENTIDALQYQSLTEESGIDDSIAFTGWKINGWTAEVKEHYYPVYDEIYSQYVFNINISKIIFNSFLKTFLPVIFITLVVLFSFLLDPDKVPTRLGMVGSSLVASVMFHVSISSQIPPVGYLTFADKFMILTYFVLLASFILNIAMLECQQLKRTSLVEKMHRYTKYPVFVIVPLLYINLFLFFI